MSEFFTYNKELKLGKTIRILVYPNITYLKDLKKDSYIQAIKNQISVLNEIRDDLWFYLILPKPVEDLQFKNTSQHFMKFPSYIPAMRVHFNTFEFYRNIHKKFDFDLVMSHLPEHTHQVKNIFFNKTHHWPNLFGYCHWFDFKNTVTWEVSSFLQNITGLLEYDRCYLNTEYQKQLVLTEMKNTFNQETIDKVDDILKVQYLGVKESDIVGATNKTTEKIIVFNHRPEEYKDFNNFMHIVDELREQRQDFKVWIPLLRNPNRDFVIVDKYDKKEYYEKLHDCRVGVSPKQKYGGWSVATTDGLMNGTPYIMYDELYYKELQSDAEFFKSNQQAIDLLNKHLDDNDHRNKMGDGALDWMRDNLVFKKGMGEMSDYIDDLVDRLPKLKNSKKIDDIKQIVRESNGITKEEIIKKLRWGGGITWTPYRRILMDDPNIYDESDSIPTYHWIEND
jgi:glycosyltransferase involved in cell wall biosynthesis